MSGGVTLYFSKIFTCWILVRLLEVSRFDTSAALRSVQIGCHRQSPAIHGANPRPDITGKVPRHDMFNRFNHWWRSVSTYVYMHGFCGKMHLHKIFCPILYPKN
jgi:hypothetical protein